LSLACEEKLDSARDIREAVGIIERFDKSLRELRAVDHIQRGYVEHISACFLVEAVVFV